MWRRLVVGLLAGLLMVWSSFAQGTAEFVLSPQRVHISDGDTFSFMDHKVRILGIDAPESAQEYGLQARQALENFFRSADNIRVVCKEKDRYGRDLCQVFGVRKKQEFNIAKEMVCGGHAWAYRTKNTPADPNLLLCEESARRNGIGLWQNENPTPPWEWRKETNPSRLLRGIMRLF